MKRLSILFLILALILVGCAELGLPQEPKEEVTPVEEQTQQEETEETEETPKETPTAEQPTEDETEVKETEEAQAPPEETEDKGGLKIKADKIDERFLNAFLVIDESEQNKSYLQIPKVEGDENLAGFVKQKMDEGFFKKATDNWTKILEVQDSKQQDDSYGHFTVYQVKTSVFDDEKYAVVLGRVFSVFGYELPYYESKIFYVQKSDGEFLGPKDQLAQHGKTIEEAMELLQRFQTKNTDVDVSHEIKGKLMSGDTATHQKLSEEHGWGKTLIINNFSSHEAYDSTDIFVYKEGNKEYYVTKFFIVRLGQLLNDQFVEEAWVRIPVDYKDGKLTMKPDAKGEVDYVYE